MVSLKSCRGRALAACLLSFVPCLFGAAGETTRVDIATDPTGSSSTVGGAEPPIPNYVVINLGAVTDPDTDTPFRVASTGHVLFKGNSEDIAPRRWSFQSGMQDLATLSLPEGEHLMPEVLDMNDIGLVLGSGRFKYSTTYFEPMQDDHVSFVEASYGVYWLENSNLAVSDPTNTVQAAVKNEPYEVAGRCDYQDGYYSDTESHLRGAISVNQIECISDQGYIHYSVQETETYATEGGIDDYTCEDGGPNFLDVIYPKYSGRDLVRRKFNSGTMNFVKNHTTADYYLIDLFEERFFQDYPKNVYRYMSVTDNFVAMYKAVYTASGQAEITYIVEEQGQTSQVVYSGSTPIQMINDDGLIILEGALVTSVSSRAAENVKLISSASEFRMNTAADELHTIIATDGDELWVRRSRKDLITNSVEPAKPLSFTEYSMKDLVPQGSDPTTPLWSNFKLTDVANNGMICGTAQNEEGDVCAVLLLKMDLDVNNDGDVTDDVDGLDSYLPGYEGDVAKLNSGTTFGTASYSGAQAVRLVLEAEITGAKFKIKDDVTSYDGYCVNGTDPALGGSNDEDFSFAAGTNKREIDATVAAGETSAVLYCKDYGAACTVEVIVNGNAIFEVQVPQDQDGDDDQLADAWQVQQIEEWNTQYNASLDTSIKNLSTTWPSDGDKDREEEDPDESGSLHPHKTQGDGLDFIKEYRGYITDFGPNHTGGHKRFSAAKKELLVEVSEMADIQTAINTGENPSVSYSLQNLQSSVSELYANVNHGVGVDVYWAKDSITNLGGLVDYNANGTLDNGERPQAHLWTGVVEKSNGNANIGGGAYVRSDRKLQILNNPLYQALYNGPTGSPDVQKVFQDNRHAELKDFTKLVLLNRWGRVLTNPSNLSSANVNLTTPVMCKVELIGPAVSKTAQSDHTYEGALIAVTGLAEEAIELHGGNHYSAVEFSNVFAWAVAHELGHLIVGSAHPGIASTALMAVPPGPERLGIAVVRLESGEMKEMDFKDKASVYE